MKNILIISALFPPEPVVSAILSKDLAQKLSEKYNIVVLCPRPSRPEGYLFEEINEPHNYKVVRLHSLISPASRLVGRFRESFSFGKLSADYIKQNASGIDCIYINAWPLASQYLIIKAAKVHKIPCVLHIQDIYPESLVNKLPKFIADFMYNLLLPVDKFILKNSRKIIGISKNMITYLSETRKIESSAFELVRNWQDDQAFLDHVPELTRSAGFIFMYVGSISASAGVENLIYAFDKAALKDTRLLIVGNGAEKNNCLKIARELKNQHIEFSEVIPENVPAIQAQADVLLLPLKKGVSLTATPSKLTAYLFSGKPVIAGVEEGSDVANILDSGNCGFVVAPEDMNEMAMMMKEAVEMDRNRLQEMGEKGKAYAMAHLSKEANLNKLVKIMEDI